MRPGLALLFIALGAGCAKPAPAPAQLLAEETALVEATVTDPERAELLLKLLTERDRLIDETGSMRQKYRHEMQALNADYDASRDLLVEMIDYYNRERAGKQLGFIDLVTKMKGALTAAEWDVIAEFQLTYFNPRQLLFDGRWDRSAMLNAILSVYSLGGGLMGGLALNPAEVEAMAARTEVSVTDRDRVTTVLEVLDELMTEVENFRRIFIDSGERLGDIYRDHAAGSRQMLLVLEALNLEWYASQNRTIKLRDPLRQSMTTEEWNSIFGDK